MKKVLLLTVALGLLATAAFAQNYNNGYGYGYGYGYGNGNGYCGQNNGHMGNGHMGGRHMGNGYMGNGHMGNGYMGWNQQQVVVVKSEQEAKDRVTQFIKDADLKGYKVNTAQTFTMNNGLANYVVSATDSSKNEVEFRVWPNGEVSGPAFKTMYNNRY